MLSLQILWHCVIFAITLVFIVIFATALKIWAQRKFNMACNVPSLGGGYEWIEITFVYDGSWGYESIVQKCWKELKVILYQQCALSFLMAQS